MTHQIPIFPSTWSNQRFITSSSNDHFKNYNYFWHTGSQIPTYPATSSVHSPDGDASKFGMIGSFLNKSPNLSIAQVHLFMECRLHVNFVCRSLMLYGLTLYFNLHSDILHVSITGGSDLHFLWFRLSMISFGNGMWQQICEDLILEHDFIFLASYLWL